MASAAVVCSAQPGPILDLTIDTGVVAPKRFVAAKGERSLLEGYASHSLEGWIYPFQIFDGLEVSFQHGNSGPLPGSQLLRRVICRPESITRTYAAQDFTVRETLFVPRDKPGIVLTYEVLGAPSIAVTVEFHPVLDLMWPAGMGGQDASWSEQRKAFRLAEGSGTYQAFIGSPQTIAHNEPNGYRAPWSSARRLSLTMNATPRATLAVSMEDADNAFLSANAPAMEAEAQRYYQQLRSSIVELETPDDSVNRAFAWAEIAVHQAWVCNPSLGCGLVAGYGPSRDTRRPQYAWFFAGDGLVTINALEAIGSHALARRAYEFLEKHQNHQTGMMWHEISQSASFLDWFGKLPWAFGHVNISAQYVAQFGRTFAWSADRNELQSLWPSLEKAHRFSTSLLGPDGLPRIPAGKQGQNEQNQMSEELSLSHGWVTAAEAYANLAEAMNQPQAAAEARKQARAVSLLPRYWDQQRNFPVLGIRADGSQLKQQMSSAIALAADLPEQFRSITLDRLSSQAFITDWGMRSVPVDDAAFQASSYAGGSVWPIGTAAAARAFWQAHRPLTALPLWHALVEESFTDSPGHIDEVFAGTTYRELDVSVPEQSWSSAGFITATMEGLLGIEPDAPHHHLTLAPHLPAQWDKVSLRHLQIGSSRLSFTETKHSELRITNEGDPIDITYSPQIPLGSSDLTATLDGKPLPVILQQNETDTHAPLNFHLVKQATIEIHYTPGLQPLFDLPVLKPGDPSQGVRIIHSTWRDQTYTTELETLNGICPAFTLQTQWKPAKIEGAQILETTKDALRLQVTSPCTRNTVAVHFPR